MAFGAKKIFPLDTKPGTAIGVSLPFNAPATFFSTYVTKDAIKNNLINYLLTSRTERYLNNDFGADLRKFIFEQITTDNKNFLKENIQSLIQFYFPNIKVEEVNVTGYEDINEIDIEIKYSIINTGITDQIQITLS